MYKSTLELCINIKNDLIEHFILLETLVYRVKPILKLMYKMTVNYLVIVTEDIISLFLQTDFMHRSNHLLVFALYSVKPSACI